MGSNNYDKKRRVEREVFSVSLAFLDVPSTSTKEGQRVYRASQRRIEKCVNDPVFISEFAMQYQGFSDFLRRYDLNTSDFRKFLGTDMHSLVRRIDKK